MFYIREHKNQKGDKQCNQNKKNLSTRELKRAKF